MVVVAVETVKLLSGDRGNSETKERNVLGGALKRDDNSNNCCWQKGQDSEMSGNLCHGVMG